MTSSILIRAALAAALVLTPAAGAGITTVVQRPGGLVIWAGDAESLSRGSRIPGARSAALSPDGLRIAYAVRAGQALELRLAPAGAGPARTIARVAGSRVSLAFAPDGRRLAVAYAGGLSIVHLDPPVRRERVPLPPAWARSLLDGLAFSPDGLTLAFSRTWGDGRADTLRNEVALVGVDGSGPRALHRNPDPYSTLPRPVFSPDGRAVAFRVDRLGLAVVPAGGGRLVRLPLPPRSKYVGDPLFSPDGASIAFARSSIGGVSEVWVAPTAGGPPRRLTSTPLPPRGVGRVGSSPLAWSPDGARLLAFRHDRFAVVDVGTGASATIAVSGIEYAVGPAGWR